MYPASVRRKTAPMARRKRHNIAHADRTLQLFEACFVEKRTTALDNGAPPNSPRLHRIPTTPTSVGVHDGAHPFPSFSTWIPPQLRLLLFLKLDRDEVALAARVQDATLCNSKVAVGERTLRRCRRGRVSANHFNNIAGVHSRLPQRGAQRARQRVPRPREGGNRARRFLRDCQRRRERRTNLPLRRFIARLALVGMRLLHS